MSSCAWGRRRSSGTAPWSPAPSSWGISEAALHLTLLEKLSAFHDRYPGVRLRLTNDSTPQAIAALSNGHADFAVVTTPFQAPKPLRSTPLLRFREILICGRQHQELARVPVSLRDLTGQSFICIGSGSGTYDFYQQLFTRNNLPFRVDMEAATMDQVLPMIRCGLGIGFCPEAMAARPSPRGTSAASPCGSTSRSGRSASLRTAPGPRASPCGH